MASVQRGAAVGLLAQLALLAVLAVTVGLGAAGWAVGLACGVVANAGIARGLVRSRARGFGPANRVTIARATLVGAVAALVADTFRGAASVPVLVGLAAVALVLDAIDGWVARRTATTSPLGARFDAEVDSFLILVLSGYVASSGAWWVLTIGAARYAFVVAGRLLPWLRRPLPARYWGKVVAAIQGITLTVAAADVVPRSWMQVALVASLALLMESFGRSVWWLWRRRHDALGLVTSPGRRRLRSVTAATTTVLAGLLVWVALVGPNQLSSLTPGAFVRIPIEGVLVALAAVLSATAQRFMAWIVGPALGLLLLVKVLDVGFFATFDRPFNPVVDLDYAGIGVETLRLSVGGATATLALIGVALLGVAVLALTTLSVLRLARLAARHRTSSLRTVTALGVAWVLCAVLGAQIEPGLPIASTSASRLVYEQQQAVRTGLPDRATFASEIARDRFDGTSGDRLLTGLRGKDVILAFVESYGRVAVQGPAVSPPVAATLDAGTKQLRAAGFASRSAFLTSPTFGGLSWLAHATLQSGLRVDTQRRYSQLVNTDRLTLSEAFRRAGWRTVADMPSDNRTWPEGTSFYHYDKLYDRRNVGYHGPTFSYAAMPDQYVMSAFNRLELAPRHPPVMAEIDLVSSHAPWTRIPNMIDWTQLGDGSIFAPMATLKVSQYALYTNPPAVRAAYGQSIAYTMSTLISFMQRYAADNLVLILVGDHQPATVVTGENASHDVPITIIARDKRVMDRISSWGWQDGLHPDPHAPVWPMSSFRDRFLSAFG
ncbi:MAG: hypothetical protein QOJ90_2133 [Actinomycetota bacterium]|nr:hypothetical protein [Actinomycetota bacterium]